MVQKKKIRIIIEPVKETFYFKSFPDFNINMPNCPGNLIVTYADGKETPYTANFSLSDYYQAACINLSNKDQIKKIDIFYERETKIVIEKEPEEIAQNKSLF
jgi:hypothetical protein